MRKWEYNNVEMTGFTQNDIQKVNSYGEDGWELISLWRTIDGSIRLYTFKRPRKIHRRIFRWRR